jgi:hypothetical protein
VLPVGGIKEKVVAAAAAGLTRVMLPARNRRDYDEIPLGARNKLEFIWLEHHLQFFGFHEFGEGADGSQHMRIRAHAGKHLVQGFQAVDFPDMGDLVEVADDRHIGALQVPALAFHIGQEFLHGFGQLLDMAVFDRECGQDVVGHAVPLPLVGCFGYTLGGLPSW